jgi:hypothetical protein
MRTILGFVPLLICVGAMVACARMAMKHALPDRTQTPVPDHLTSETEVHDG